MAKILINSLPEKTTPVSTDILVIQDTITQKITLGNLLQSKQDMLIVNPQSTTGTLTGLGINGVNYAIQGGGGGTITDIKINNTSIVSSGVANFNTQTAYNASTNKIATIADINSAIIDAIEGSY